MAKQFGPLAHETRVEAGVSLRKVAIALDFTPAYISDIERGNRNAPSPDVARRWASVVGGDADRFERAARIDRKVVELWVDADQPDIRRNDVAVALARSWDELTDIQLNAIADALEVKDE